MLVIVNYFTKEGKKEFKSFRASYQAEEFIKTFASKGYTLNYIERPFGW